MQFTQGKNAISEVLIRRILRNGRKGNGKSFGFHAESSSQGLCDSTSAKRLLLWRCLSPAVSHRGPAALVAAGPSLHRRLFCGLTLWTAPGYPNDRPGKARHHHERSGNVNWELEAETSDGGADA